MKDVTIHIPNRLCGEVGEELDINVKDTCGVENVLTPKDVRLGYQCDACADRAEGGF